MLPPLTPDDLEAYLRAHHIAGEVLRLEQPTPTVAAAAEAVGVSPDAILKTVIFMAQGKPIAVIARGQARVNARALARHLGVGRKKVRVARAEEVLEATGYPAGAVPPLGHRRALPTYIDPRVLESTEAFAGGGAHNALLRIEPAVLLEATNAEVVSVQTDASAQ